MSNYKQLKQIDRPTLDSQLSHCLNGDVYHASLSFVLFTAHKRTYKSYIIVNKNTRDCIKPSSK